MKGLILMATVITIFAVIIGLAKADEEEDSGVDDYSIIVPETPRNIHDCIVVEVCNTDGDCQWRLTCP